MPRLSISRLIIRLATKAEARDASAKPRSIFIMNQTLNLYTGAPPLPFHDQTRPESAPAA
jgi:hypothetical protein